MAQDHAKSFDQTGHFYTDGVGVGNTGAQLAKGYRVFTQPTITADYVKGVGGASTQAGTSAAPPKVGSSLSDLSTGVFDGQEGIIRVGSAPDDHEEYFTWNSGQGKWIGQEYCVIATDDAWALDLSRQPIASFQNAWCRFNGGVGWYKNGPRAYLRSSTTLPTGTINISTNEDSTANGLATSGQVLIRDQLVTYTGYVTTANVRQLTGCTGGTGTFPATYTPVIPYGAASGGDYGGWGTTVTPLDRVGELWAAGFRLQERARGWLNGSQDSFALTIAPYYQNHDLNIDFNYPGIWSAPSGGLGFGVPLTGGTAPLAATRIDERGFKQFSTSWTAWSATAPSARVLHPTLYGKMPVSAQDAGEVYGYMLTLRWVG